MLHHIVLAAYSVSATPTPGKLDKPLQQLLNLLVATGLILAAIGFVTGAAASSVGGHGGNYGLAIRGKSMMGWAAAAAVLIAGATAIINWFWGLGLLI